MSKLLYFGNVLIWPVQKLNGIWRLIVDSRRELNKVSIPIDDDDDGHIPNILEKIRPYAKIFTILDIINKIWSLPLKEIY